MSAALEAQIDDLAGTVPGVAAVYEVARPFGGRLVMRKIGAAAGATKSFARGVGAVAEATVCVGLSPTADAELVRDAIAAGIRALPGLDECRVHVRISRVHYEDSALI